MATKNRALYISHGGGPLPLLGDSQHVEMVENLKLLAKKIKKPSAILLVSAHWEQKVATITAAPHPPLIYDYYGFPQESYSIQYPCSGEPSLAQNISDLLSKANIESSLDEARGFDHGLFVPLKIMYPEADIPCVQLSLLKGLDPKSHIELGRALANIEYENLLMIGSGFSFHNMRAFFALESEESQSKNESFEAWLIESASDKNLTEEERTKRLIEWEQAPNARFCHPREEHLLPLHVCYGFTQSACTEYFELNIIGKKSSIYLWDEQ